MAGFLGCFGCTKKKKRPKGGNKNASSSSAAAHRYGSYVPLDSDATLKLDGNEKKQEGSADLIRGCGDKAKESAAAKIKKKVSFNLNLKTYEPIPNEESNSFCVEEETAASFPPNHRYANYAAYEEDDEIEFEEIEEEEDELDFDEDDFAEEEFDPDYSRMRQGVQPEPNHSARKRSEFASSVLNPVQNLSQWKEVKANSKQQLKLQKENIRQQPASQIKKSVQPSPEVAVDASLSGWLGSSRSY